MEKRSFAVMYALRELKMRRRQFLPVICITAGVMILLFNIMIFIQSSYVSDLAYYKTNAHIIMPGLTYEEAEALGTYSCVEAVEVVPDGGTYICYVDIRDEYHKNYITLANCGLELITGLNLTDRTPYNGYYLRYQNFGMREFWSCSLFNFRYINRLAYPPMQSGIMEVLILFSAAMIVAAVSLVFGMKIRRGIPEFAVMRAMGAKMSVIHNINALEAVGIVGVLFLPSLAVSLLTMRLVCWISEFIYSDYSMNTVLHFTVPWIAIAISFFLYLVGTYIAVLLCSRRIRARTVTELVRGDTAKIPFVEKSSAKLLNLPASSRYGRTYGKVELKRNFRNFLPTQILFAALILFPMLLFGLICTFVIEELDDIRLSDQNQSLAYTIEYSSPSSDFVVGRSVMEKLRAIDGVTDVRAANWRSLYLDDSVKWDMPEEYEGENISYSFQQCTPEWDEIAPEKGTCSAPSGLFEIGDEITFTYHGNSVTLTVAGLNDSFEVVAYNRMKWYKAIVYISDEDHAEIMGWDEPRYPNAYVYSEKGREEEVIAAVDRLLGVGDSYLNDYDRWLHQRTETAYTTSATFVENRIDTIREVFTFSFLGAQVLYLLICAGAVIYSMSAFIVDGRKKELSILRALGMYGEDIRRLATWRQVIGIIIMASVAFVIVTPVVILMEQNIYFEYSILEDRYILKGTEQLIAYIIGYFTASLIALFGYGMSAYRASVSSVNRITGGFVADNVKNNE